MQLLLVAGRSARGGPQENLSREPLKRIDPPGVDHGGRASSGVDLIAAPDGGARALRGEPKHEGLGPRPVAGRDKEPAHPLGLHGRRDETCPISTRGGTRRVQSVREGGREGGGGGGSSSGRAAGRTPNAERMRAVCRLCAPSASGARLTSRPVMSSFSPTGSVPGRTSGAVAGRRPWPLEPASCPAAVAGRRPLPLPPLPSARDVSG